MHMIGMNENVELARLVGTETTIGPARLSESEIAVEPQSAQRPMHPIETEQKVELGLATEIEATTGPARLSETEITIELRSRPGGLGDTAESTVNLLE